MNKIKFLLIPALFFIACSKVKTNITNVTHNQFISSVSDSDKVIKSEEEWKDILTDEQYEVLREKGTEMPYANEYCNNHEEGIYKCAACGNLLFTSETKFESGTGWPSFYAPAGEKSVVENTDNTHGMVRTEVVCRRCGSHLGHVFDDGPPPTGLRYCMNSVAMKFEKK